MSLRERLRGKPKRPPRDYTALVLQAQLTGQKVAEILKGGEIPLPESTDLSPGLRSIIGEEIKIPPIRVTQLQKYSDTYYAEGVTPSLSREVLFEMKGPATIIDCVVRSQSDSYSIGARRDKKAYYSSDPLTHTKWRKLSASLTKINAYQETDGTFLWGIYGIEFQREFRLVVVDAEDVTFETVVVNWELDVF